MLDSWDGSEKKKLGLENLYIKCFPGQSYNGKCVHSCNKWQCLLALLIYYTAHRAMKDVKAMQAMFTSNLLKKVLPESTIRNHTQIISYWQEKSREWLGAQQFVTDMGRDCTKTMAVRLNENGVTYDKLRDAFEKFNCNEASFHEHLQVAGVTRRAWRSEIWLHFQGNSCLLSSIF